MLKNYLKSAFRFIQHNKIFAGINLMGLSIALAASFIMLLYVINELSYNSCHKRGKNVYHVLNFNTESKVLQGMTPYVLASTLKNEFPQVLKAVNIRPTVVQFKVRDEIINTRATATSSDIFDIFTIPMIYGNGGNNLLDDLNSLVLSRDLAERFFPKLDPTGKEIIGIINNQEYLFVVKGVYENIPINSTIRPDCLVNSKWAVPQIQAPKGETKIEENWGFTFWDTWILLADRTFPEEFEKQFRPFEKKHISINIPYRFSLQNLGDIYLHSQDIVNIGKIGNLKKVKLFSLIAFLIVIVAAFNYILLSTAVSSARAKEIGIRKTFGANKANIRNQLLSESMLLVLLVLPVALILTRLALPAAGNLFQMKLSIITSNIPLYIGVYLILTILIGLLSGVYTSSFLSHLKIMDILKNNIQTGRRKQLVRSTLIVLQLVIFSTFVSSTLIIRSQYEFALKKDTGHYTSDILFVDLGRNFKDYSSFINSLMASPNIIMAAGTMESLPAISYTYFMFQNFKEPEKKVKVEGIYVDYNFISTMGIPILQGREFSKEFPSDLTYSCILNETAIKELGIDDPLGKKLGNWNIIGVMKDFNLQSIRTQITPTFICMTNRYIQQVAVHYKKGSLENILPFIKTEWKKVASNRPFIYQTIEDLLKEVYSSEKNLSIVVSIFALFTLLIAALGLFGLTLFVARSRRKEIGIKKVFGSSERAIVYSFLKNNLILVLMSALLSIPITLYFMNKWLSNFAFKVNIDWLVFVFSFAVAAIVVLFTVYIHSYKASRTNPVKALRYE